MKPRKKDNTTRINALISFCVHAVIITALFIFAAREGMLGKKLQKFTAVIVPKQKPPETPKPKPPEPQVEPPKEVAPTPQNVPPPVQSAQAAAPTEVAPVVAPPPAIGADFSFADGAKMVQTSSDPHVLYKGQVEYTLRSRWVRPEGVADESYVAEVAVTIDPTGKITGHEWKKSSGDKLWDDSVNRALAQTKAMSRPPPKGFPGSFLVRFDVVADSEPIAMQ